MSKWMLRQAAVDVKQLAKKWGLDPVLAHILAVRGFRTKDEVEAFLQATAMDLPQPTLFADMPRAVSLIAEAIASQVLIAIFGDYDADGVCSTVILHKTLTALGAKVCFYIPQRENEGYGLNNEAIFSLKQQEAGIILACDNGVSALEQVIYANSLGMEVIILDHHDLPCDGEGRQSLVPAAAVVNAKRQDCPYPFKLYCAAGLCYRFSAALYQYLELDWSALEQELLPFAAVGTVCDLVELLGENRALVQRGLPAVAESGNPGLTALRKATGLAGQGIGVYQVGFRLGPCINASGRLKDAGLAVELFLTEDPERAALLASYLVELNETRKNLTEQGVQLALKAIEQNDLAADKIIVVHCPNLHESVAGIVAGRLKEQYHKPVLVVAGDKETVRGSGRSIEAYHMYVGLSACSELFLNFGGHPMAAGFSIMAGNVPLLRTRLNQSANLTAEDMQQIFRVDKLLPLGQATLALAKNLQIFEPYGKGNHPVCFADRGVRLSKITLLGQNKQVLRMCLQSPGMKAIVEAVCFDGKGKLQELLQREYGEVSWANLLLGRPPTVTLDILYTLNINTYQGRQSAQIQVVDFRPAQT